MKFRFILAILISVILSSEKYVNIYLLHKVMTEKDVRRTLITATMDHLKNNKLPILNLTPDILKKRKKEIKLKKKIEKWQKKQDA